MNLRTYKILAKWIANEFKLDIVFDRPDDGAHCTIKNKTIHLPTDIEEKNAFAALALLMHEAAHLRWTKELPDDIARDQLDHNILNVIEDIRIDLKNMRKLYNIKGFYEKMYEETQKKFDKDDKAPLWHRVLVNCILRLEGFYALGYQDKEALDFFNTSDVEYYIYDAMNAIGSKDWEKLKEKIVEIRKKLGLPDPVPQDPNDPNGQQAGGQGAGKDQGEAIAELAEQVKDLQDKMHPAGKVFGKGEGMKGKNTDKMTEAQLEEQTVRQFNELLNVKEIQEVDDGTVLDTDNLIAYFTGDADELFKDDKIVKNKKSKLLFLLDKSGSMSDHLIDKATCSTVTLECVNKLTSILDSLAHQGMNIDYDVAMFDSGYHRLDKDSWRDQYYVGGGTSIEGPFDQALEDLSRDYAIDGKKLMIIMTDGQVHANEIDHIVERLKRIPEDIRVMFIGINADPSGAYSHKVIGDNIIMAKEQSNLVLLETIMQML